MATSSTAHPRQPKGQPTGGQFAAKSNPESDIELEPSQESSASLGAPAEDDEVWSWNAVAKVLGEEEAKRLFAESNGSLGKALAIAVRNEMAEAERHVRRAIQLDPRQVERLATHGLTPDDLLSPDRDTRMAAHSAMGALVFEDELLSNAYQLYRHVPGIAPDRTFHAPGSVVVDGTRRPWAEMGATDQLAYINGYAQAIGGEEPPDVAQTNGALSGAGYAHGRQTLADVAAIETGSPGPFSIVEPDAQYRKVAVANPRWVPERHGYVATVAERHYWWRHSETGSSLVPVDPGRTVFFAADALGAP